MAICFILLQFILHIIYVCTVLGTSAGVQAVATSPVLTTAITAAAGSAPAALPANESVTSSADGGMEFTLDAATLEQLRGAGDASALMESSTAAAGFGDDQPAMQVTLVSHSTHVPFLIVQPCIVFPHLYGETNWNAHNSILFFI